MSQTEKTKKGIKWSIIDQVVRQCITLVISGILSRLLTPAEYGLLGMVTVAIGFLQVFKDMGLGSSVIQKQGITMEEQSSIFWLNLVIGLFLTIFLLITAPWIARFFNEPQLTALIRVMSLSFVIGSMSIVPDALIRKAIDFKSYFYRNLGTIIAGGLLGIGLAYKGFGVWALIGQSLLTTITGVIISFRMVQWRPQPVFKKHLLKSHLRYSIPLLGDSSINYWVRNIDSLLVGKFLGSAPLGIYNRAYSLMLLPVTQISATLSRVIFPSFAIIQNNKELIWEQYGKMMSTVAMFSFPLMALLGVYARECILIVYGHQWMEVVPLFRTLCFLGAVQSVASIAGPVYFATGKTGLLFKIGLASKTLMISGIVAGLYFGQLKGMVWGYVFSSTLASLIESYFVSHTLVHTLKSYFKNILAECFAASILLLILIFAYLLYSSSGNSLSYSFITFHLFAALLALVCYVYLLRTMQSKGYLILKNHWYDKRKKNTSSHAR